MIKNGARLFWRKTYAYKGGTGDTESHEGVDDIKAPAVIVRQMDETWSTMERYRGIGIVTDTRSICHGSPFSSSSSSSSRQLQESKVLEPIVEI